MFERMRNALLGGCIITGCVAASGATSWGIELPAGPLANLRSEEFRTRESAQAELLAWARLQPEGVMNELLRHSRGDNDPEVRERCLAVLKELVNDEFLKDGEGFIGIQMLDELANIPGDPNPRGAVRVIMLVPDSAAQKAGLQLNDLIIGMGDQVWHELGASLVFRERIRQLKPNTKITLKVLRNGNPLEIEVKLGRRPITADLLFFDQRQFDPEAAERAAKDGYFRRWLERGNSRK